MSTPRNPPVPGAIDVTEHVGLVHLLLRRYFKWARPGLYFDYDDLVQVGMIGVLKAAERWDPAKGAWATCVTFSVRGEVSTFVRKAMDLKSKEVRRECSFEDHVTEGEEDNVGPEIFGYAHVDQQDFDTADGGEYYLRGLEGRRLVIARQKFLRGMTLHQIGKHHGISRERVRQILNTQCRQIVEENLVRAGSAPGRDRVAHRESW